MTNLYQLKRITDEDTAREILGMIRGELDPCEVSPAADRWRRQCYHPPGHNELTLEAANELLGTCGVEGSADDDGRDGCTYCNTGDTYDLTLFLDHGRFKVSSVGTMVERGSLR